MKFLIRTIRFLKLTGSKVLIGLFLAGSVSVLCMSTASADRDDGPGWGNWGGHQGWRGGGDDYYEHRRGYYGYGYGGYGRYLPPYPAPYGYAQPVYVPPPVYYPPLPSPGISLFFPLNIHR